MEPYRGCVLRSRSIGRWKLVETEFGPCATVRMHRHEHPYVSFLIRGSYNENSGSCSHECSPGSVIFHPAEEKHADEFSRLGGLLLNLQLDRGWLDRLPVKRAPARISTQLLEVSAYTSGLMLHSLFESLSPTELENVAIELAAHVCERQRLPNSMPGWMKNALGMISAAVAEGENVSLQAAAQECGVHPIHLARSFPRYCGAGFSRYVNQLRVYKAFRLLLESPAPVTEIALACGFYDHAHLCHAIKSAIGLSPVGFRARFQGPSRVSLLRRG